VGKSARRDLGLGVEKLAIEFESKGRLETGQLDSIRGRVASAPLTSLASSPRYGPTESRSSYLHFSTAHLSSHNSLQPLRWSLLSAPLSPRVSSRSSRCHTSQAHRQLTTDENLILSSSTRVSSIESSLRSLTWFLPGQLRSPPSRSRRSCRETGYVLASCTNAPHSHRSIPRL
jgi:hypothetical protein